MLIMEEIIKRKQEYIPFHFLSLRLGTLPSTKEVLTGSSEQKSPVSSLHTDWCGVL